MNFKNLEKFINENRKINEINISFTYLSTINIYEFAGYADLEIYGICNLNHINDNKKLNHSSIIKRIIFPDNNHICEFIGDNSMNPMSKKQFPFNGYLIEGHNFTKDNFSNLKEFNATCQFIESGNPCLNIDSDKSQAFIGNILKTFKNDHERELYCINLHKFISIEGYDYKNDEDFDKEILSNNYQNDLLQTSMIEENKWTHGGKSLLVYLIEFSDNLGYPSSIQNIYISLLKVGEILRQYSYNKTWFNNITIIPKLIFVDAKIGCQSSRSIAINEGNNLGYLNDNYDLDILFFKKRNCGGWAGLARIGSKGNWINWDNFYRELYTYAVVLHEFGHNFGLLHAGNKETKIRKFDEYGDTTDIMGDSSDAGSHFNVGFKRKLGWITEKNTYILDENFRNNRINLRLFAFDHIYSLEKPKIALVIKILGGFITGGIRSKSHLDINNGVIFNEFYSETSRSLLIDVHDETYTQDDIELNFMETIQFDLVSKYNFKNYLNEIVKIDGTNIGYLIEKINLRGISEKNELVEIPYMDIEIWHQDNEEQKIEDDIFCITIIINSLSYGNEKIWRILEKDSNKLVNGCYSDGVNSYNVNIFHCALKKMDYNFQVKDSYGDGWDGATYELISNSGNILIEKNTIIEENKNYKSNYFSLKNESKKCLLMNNINDTENDNKIRTLSPTIIWEISSPTSSDNKEYCTNCDFCQNKDSLNLGIGYGCYDIFTKDLCMDLSNNDNLIWCGENENNLKAKLNLENKLDNVIKRNIYDYFKIYNQTCKLEKKNDVNDKSDIYIIVIIFFVGLFSGILCSLITIKFLFMKKINYNSNHEIEEEIELV